MPSIFVWKAASAIVSSMTMKYYSGSNWFLEEIGEVTRSMLLIDSMQYSDAIAYHAQRMPQNWVGSEVLEIMEVPYQLIKEDDYAVLEQLGTWMRCTLKQEFSFEFEAIQEWIAAKKPTTVLSTTNNACLINFNISNVTTHNNKINHTNGNFNHAHRTMVKA